MSKLYIFRMSLIVSTVQPLYLNSHFFPASMKMFLYLAKLLRPPAVETPVRLVGSSPSFCLACCFSSIFTLQLEIRDRFRGCN